MRNASVMTRRCGGIRAAVIISIVVLFVLYGLARLLVTPTTTLEVTWKRGASEPECHQERWIITGWLAGRLGLDLARCYDERDRDVDAGLMTMARDWHEDARRRWPEGREPLWEHTMIFIHGGAWGYGRQDLFYGMHGPLEVHRILTRAHDGSVSKVQDIHLDQLAAMPR